MAMAAMASRVITDKPLHFLRQSFGLFRNLSAASSASAQSQSVAGSGSAAADSEKSKSKKNKKKNLFDVVQFLPNWGIGYKVAKSHWRDVLYEITKVNLYKDGRHGKAWGIRYKAGARAAEAPIKISGVNKRGWKYIKESEKKSLDLPKIEEKVVEST